MESPLQQILSLASAVLALIGAAYILTAAAAPKLFASVFSPEPKTAVGNAALAVFAGLLILGVGCFLYGGFGMISQAIPSNWGSVQEEGWRSARGTFRVVATIVATLLVFAGVARSGRSSD